MEIQQHVPKGSLISAMFLVGGTCVGGGMLALPVATGISGFFPSVIMMVICWLAMTCSALFLLEASLWMNEGAHVISMASKMLGTIGKVVSWGLYLFICYASLVAYTAGGGLQLISTVDNVMGWSLTKEVGNLVFILGFGSIIYLGTRIVGRVNAVLFVGMIGAYFCLVGLGISEVKPHLLLNRNWSMSIMAVPLLLTSFSFQTMVPSLTPLLKSNGKALRFAIIGGTTIALVVYIIWQWLVLGIVPVEGSNGLAAALASGEPATQFLREEVGGSWIAIIAEYFAFFALVTSFLGMALGLFDFLSDGLKIKKEGIGKFILGLLIVLPTLFFATYFERAFLLALDTSGGFGDSILNGIMPVLMVWMGRYRMGIHSDFRIPGGKLLLSTVLVFFASSLILEILVHTGHVFSIYDVHEIYDIREINKF